MGRWRPGPTPAQAKNRRCFQACVAAWNALPAECPPAPHCGGVTTKESVYEWKQGRGVLSSYYDMFLRCCLGLCDDTGALVGDVNTCWPCPPEFDSLTPDPGNPETISESGSAVLCVTGGVPPYSWVRIYGDCISPASGSGACITATHVSAGCCGAEWEVTDACGNKTYVGVRGTWGRWVLTARQDCPFYGYLDSTNCAWLGVWRVCETVDQCGTISWESATQEDCFTRLAQEADYCDGKCSTGTYCDPVLGCEIPMACIYDKRAPFCDPENSCTIPGMEEYGSWVCRCIKERTVYHWEC